MTTQYTPGPWIIYDDSNDGKTNRIEIAARGKTVAHIYHSVPEEDLPNANLIAAAPDLLEALKMGYADTMDYIQRNHLSGSENNHWLVLARAAIAKATGQE
jgi:hypothetical protein